MVPKYDIRVRRPNPTPRALLFTLKEFERYWHGSNLPWVLPLTGARQAASNWEKSVVRLCSKPKVLPAVLVERQGPHSWRWVAGPAHGYKMDTQWIHNGYVGMYQKDNEWILYNYIMVRHRFRGTCLRQLSQNTDIVCRLSSTLLPLLDSQEASNVSGHDAPWTAHSSKRSLRACQMSRISM